MHRSRTIFTLLALASILFTNLLLPPRAAAQDLVATEDIAGGSSVFVFKEGRKKPQVHAAVGHVHNRNAERARSMHMSAAAKAAAQKRRTEAVAHRKKIVRTNAGDRRAALSNTLTLKAEGFLDNGQTDLAITNFRSALSQDAKNTRAAEGLSNALTAKGIDTAGDNNNAAAVPLFEEAAKLDPQNDVAFARLGAIYDAQGDSDKAAANYEKAVALNPDYKDFYPQLGIAYAEKGEIAKGQEYLEKSDKAGVQNSDVDFLRGLLAFKNNRDDVAMAAFQKTAASDPRFVDAQYYRGQILARQGKKDEAIAQYRGALQADPTYYPAAFDLGVEEYNAGNYNDAAVAYNEAIKYDHDNYQAHSNLASTYRQLEQYPAANGEYKVASTGIKNSDLYSEWGYCLGKTTEWDKAVARLNTAVEMTPTAADSSNVGWAYYNAGKFQAAAKNDPVAKSDFELARNFSQRAVSQDPKLDAAYLNLGASHNALGEFQAAVNALTSALGLHSGWVVALNQIGFGYRGLGDLNNAISAYKQVVSLDGRNTFGMFNLTEAYYANGNKKEAKKMADQLRKVDPSFSGALDAVLSGKAVIDNATQKVEQKIPKPRFPF